MSKNPNFKSNNNSNKEDNNNNFNNNNANNTKILRKAYSVKKHIKYIKKVPFKGGL